MSRKIIGITVGSPLPKPNLKQTDPAKGDYVKGKDIIPTKVSQLENDKGYLEQHQDISGKLDASELPNAINSALEQAKSSGEFKGEKGDTGPQGPAGATGATGPAGADGKDYVLTAADKTEIAEQVENATIVQAPKYVNTVEEMTDVNRPYVLISTGRIWANAETTVTKEVTKNIPIDGIVDSTRLGSDGNAVTSTGNAAYCTTPFIDLLAYPVPFTLHLDGANFIPAASTSNIRIATYTEAQAKINVVQTTATTIDSSLNVKDGDVVVDSNGNASITFNQTPKTNNNNNDGVLKYVRFVGTGSSATARVYVTYKQTETTTGVQWFDTNTSYAPMLTTEEKQAMVEEVASMVDAQLLSVIGDGVVTV